MRIAVTGAGGRLGRAIVGALAAKQIVEPDGLLAWHRPDFDLDAPEAIGALMDTSAADLVIHAAAWTDVDGCALDPQLAMRRNAHASGTLATATADRGAGLILISTNEVFDGERSSGSYGPTDRTSPANAYGASKLAAEHAAADAYARPGARGTLGILRTAWLFGPGAPDFPMKIALAARRAIAAGEPLRIVADEVGTPSYVEDVAGAILQLVASRSFAGISHLVNGGTASRAAWGLDVLQRLELSADIVEVALADFPRPSRPPHWGVLAATPLPGGAVLRHWHDAMAAYMPTLRGSITIAP